MTDFQSLFRISLGVIWLLCCCKMVMSAPVNAKDVSKGINFLTQFGYLVPTDPRTGKLQQHSAITKAIRQLQRMGHLNETGILDSATITLMGKPRCGMADFSPADKARRKRRYQLHGTYWKNKDLTYRIKGFTKDLPSTEQERIFKWAFDQWQAASQLNIREAPKDLPDDKVEILIDFKRGYHGDGYPFDGPGGTLAHAFYPLNNKGISGDAHFDDDELYTTKSSRGINLDWVALHEFGHSLGVDHSEVLGSIMYPWYQGYTKEPKLTPDDLMAIRGLYGKRQGGGPATVGPTVTDSTGPSKPPVAVDMCKVRKFDAWLYGKDDVTYAFVGDYYFTVDPRTGGGKGPFKVSEKWKELRTPITAAYTRKDGRTVFFKNGVYWKYYLTRLEEGPRRIENYGLTKDLESMDGAFIWGRNSRTYFFKGDKYWRYNEAGRRMDLGYPREMKAIWKNIPTKLDSVMKWTNGKTYFFQGRDYYRLDDFSIQSEAGYPQNIALKWMKCSSRQIQLPPTQAPVTSLPSGASRGPSDKSAATTKSSAGLAIPSLLLTVLGLFTSAHRIL